jgi:hypothetical protein
MAVRAAAVAALGGDRVGLGGSAERLADLEDLRARRGLSSSGLLDNVETLRNAVAHGGTPAFAEHQREIARSANGREERLGMEALAEGEPWPTIRRLRGEDRHNRVAEGVNLLVRRIEQLLTGQTQALLHMVNDLAFSHRAFLHPTVRERKIRAVAQRIAHESPDTPEASAAARLASGIERKIERERRRDFELRARLALEQRQWEVAEALAVAGLELWPEDPDFAAMHREADHELALRRRGWLRSLQVDPIGESGLSDLEWETVGGAVRAWILGDVSTALARVVQAKGDEQGDDPIRDHLALLTALVDERAGSRAQACETLSSLGGGDGAVAWMARELLTCPPFDPAADLERALRLRHRLTRRYILQGARSVEDNLHLASTNAISQGLAAPVSLGVLFFIDTAIRGVALGFRNPIGAEDVIDGLAALDRRQGALSERQLVMWRELLRDVGRPWQAIEIHDRLPEPDPAVRRRLSEGHARQLLASAKASAGGETRRELLSHVAKAYPDSSAASEAWRLLQAAPWEGVHLTPCEVRAHGLALMQVGWPIPPALWDGSRSNGELDDQGVWVEETGTVRHRLHGRRTWETVRASEEDAPRVVSSAKAIAAQSRRLGVLAARRRPRVPLEITGSLGASGVYAVPQLQRFRHIDDDLSLYE